VYGLCIMMLAGKLGGMRTPVTVRHRWKQNVTMDLERCVFYSYELCFETEERTRLRTFVAAAMKLCASSEQGIC
jgi:hypothetical protein